MRLDEAVNKNFGYLTIVAKRITQSKNVRMASDLVSETYLALSEKVIPEDNDEFIKWFSKSMKNQFRWSKSEFNKIYQPKEFTTLDKHSHHNQNQQKHLDGGYINSFNDLIVDEDAQRNIYLQCEQTNDFTKELFEISSSLGRAKTLKYIELIEFKRSLPPHESVLFDLYFQKELSTRNISSMYSDEYNKLSRISVNKMVNKIKDKIKTHQWKE